MSRHGPIGREAAFKTKRSAGLDGNAAVTMATGPQFLWARTDGQTDGRTAGFPVNRQSSAQQPPAFLLTLIFCWVATEAQRAANHQFLPFCSCTSAVVADLGERASTGLVGKCLLKGQ